ncbi:hypothetical protein K435DRAFT_808215 [Dendrothele bispora CBS 962.96]|uniref:Uncharacterized protein n=1 Tax=Dendrothele bispora (strain CBS 962.96) TaxID=1314807 RepID=A0A4V4HCA3_DENBC|nr:hypothetical protein K435DRAFT_872208 [Dendrothele bispora CBS 962.96]THU82526.1 hypothetical protein K435DRAFT_808215 [Dendrothele bispora CBS 962.96]
MASPATSKPILSVCSSGCGHPSTKPSLNPSGLRVDQGGRTANLDCPMESRSRDNHSPTELEQAIERERVLIGNFDRLKDDYNNLRLRVEGEVHNLATANQALNQVIATARKDLQLILNVAIRSLRGNLTHVEVDIINHARVLGSAMSAAHYSVLHDNLSTIQDRFKAVGMAYNSLTTFLNQSFNSSQAVTGFVGEQDAIMTQILRYASDEVPGLEKFLKSTPAPIPIASSPPDSVLSSSAVLAGARLHFSVPQGMMASTSTANPLDQPIHPLPERPSNSQGVIRNRNRRNRRKVNQFIQRSVNSKGKVPE